MAFFCLEGLDGSGKSTQATLLQEALAEKGYQVVRVREPGGTEIGERIRSLILSPASTAMSPSTELLLYAAARAQLLAEVVRPALDSGRIVLADRFAWSTMAYQGYGRGLDRTMIDDLAKVAVGKLWPDLTIILDIPVDVFRERSAKEGRTPDRMEREQGSFFERVREGYRNIANENPDRCLLIDGTLPPMQVARDIAQAVFSKLHSST